MFTRESAVCEVGLDLCLLPHEIKGACVFADDVAVADALAQEQCPIDLHVVPNPSEVAGYMPRATFDIVDWDLIWQRTETSKPVEQACLCSGARGKIVGQPHEHLPALAKRAASWII